MQPTPKINRRLIKRTVWFVVIILALAYGFYWLVSKHGDPDLIYAPSPTVGDIAAIESQGDGAQAVLIHPDGKIVPAPNYKNGSYDQNVTWRADGGRLFFESDRENGEPHLYRWNTDKGILERRSIDKRPKGFLSFTVPGDKQAASEASPTALMIASGTIVQIDANSGETKQLLPPYNKNSSQGGTSSEEGAQNGMAAYSAYGNSFVKALWSKDKRYIIAVLNRESGDQALIIQDMVTPKAPPFPLAQAKHIGVDVGQVSGVVVYSLLGAEIPDWIPDDQKDKFRKNGKIIPPSAHDVRMFDIDTKKVSLIATNKDDNIAFGDPVISPDESLVAFPVGSYVGGTFKAIQLVAMPPKENGVTSGVSIAPGDFSHLSWAPDSSKIVALMKGPSGSRDVVMVDPVAHSQVSDVTQGQGSFLEAVMSPQTKASSGGS